MSPYGLEFALGPHVDWVGLDLQHGDVGLPDVPGLLRVTERAGVPAFVRVASHSPQEIASVVESGADGIIVPAVESAEQAAGLVSAMFPPPVGSRSTGVARRAAVHVDRREPPLLLPMIETSAGVDNAEAILAVDHVDGLFVGPYDLTLSMGFPGPSSPETLATVGRVLALAAGRRKIAGFMAGTPELEALSPSADLVARGTDISALVDGVIRLGGVDHE